MYWLTDMATLVCAHELGRVSNLASQGWVRIENRPVLVEADPVGRPIEGCPNANPVAGIRPCRTTLVVKAGYSAFIRVDGRPVCLDTVTGLTDGTPPGAVEYKVRSPGQALVAEV